MGSQATLADVRRYWDEKPLLSMELRAAPGTPEYVAQFDAIRFAIERYALHLWEFDAHRGERVLDVGCGAPAFLVRQFARGGAKVTGIDLSPRSVELARGHVAAAGLAATIAEGNAEHLDFPDASFEFVTSAGVLHHTPDTARAVREIHRVLVPGGRAVVALYYRSALLEPPLWSLTRLAMRVALRPVPGRDRMTRATDPDEFVRMWDGDQNPVGRSYSKRAARELFAAFDIEALAPHVFHARFLKLPLGPLASIADRLGATMLYAVLRKR